MDLLGLAKLKPTYNYHKRAEYPIHVLMGGDECGGAGAAPPPVDIIRLLRRASALRATGYSNEESGFVVER